MNPSAGTLANPPVGALGTPVVLWATRHLPVRLRAGGPAAGAGVGLLAVTWLVVIASAPFLELTPPGWKALLVASTVLVALITAGIACPWQRWNSWSTFAFPVAGLAVLAGLGLATDLVAAAYLGVIPLWFLYVGLFHRVLAGALLVPVALICYVAMVGTFTPNTIVRLVIYGAVWFAISGFLAVLSGQQRLVTANLLVANHTDALTGLGNRRDLELRLADVTDGDCVVICDLDLFKSINDAFGHAAGDEVLAQFGATLDQHLRRRDYAARFGGEEFVLVLARTEPAQAFAALSSIRDEWLDLEAGVTFSAGVARVRGERSAGDALAAADAALYDAKAAGRDCFRLSRWDQLV